MQRSKFPYTARSTAKIVRHAVSIDERRAKFRQDLISGKTKAQLEGHRHRHYFSNHHHRIHHHHKQNGNQPSVNGNTEAKQPEPADRFRKRSQATVKGRSPSQQRPSRSEHPDHLNPQGSAELRTRTPSPSETAETASVQSRASSYLPPQIPTEEEWEDDEATPQDIEELWFPGCHADLGGGWGLWPGEETSLSHSPLVWMVREAQRAGLDFDEDKMIKLKCCEDLSELSTDPQPQAGMPDIQITGSPTPLASPIGGVAPSDANAPALPNEASGDFFQTPKQEKSTPGWAPGLAPAPPQQSAFKSAVLASGKTGKLHDCLEFKQGLPAGSVLQWKIMEYLPFRRMDLRADGSWKAISFPLPMGETRDIPEDAKIHGSAIERMKHDPTYRPGNLIVGGGGRGMRRAPEELGIGEWKVLKDEGDPVGHVYVRAKQSVQDRLDRGQSVDEGIEQALRREQKEEMMHP